MTGKKSSSKSSIDIGVRVVPNAKREFIDRLPQGAYHITVRESAEEGKANERVKEILAEHFNVLSKDVHIIRGAKTHGKIVRIWQSHSK